jgi:hypothetical protein
MLGALVGLDVGSAAMAATMVRRVVPKLVTRSRT